jgi:hypothetical protein
MVGVGSSVGGAGMTRLKGLRTSKSPGVPASAASVAFAAFVAQRAVFVVVLPSGNTETEESRHMYRIPGTAVRVQVQVQACVGDTDEVEQERTHTSNRGQRSTPSIQALFVAGIESE